jgi:CRISPR/Cas system CSM-associated protein Csm4 (group 5 of RAMP superfamily)
MKIKVKFYPKTEIIAPTPSCKEVVKRYIELGWLKPEQKDIHRVFPRNHEGKAYIRQSALQGVVREVSPALAKKICIEEGYILIGHPLIGQRPIMDKKTNTPRTVEIYEFIDSSFRDITFTLKGEPEILKELVSALQVAGEKGIGARRNQGYGKFVVEVVLTKEPKK